MKTKSGARRLMTAAEVAARVNELAPIFLESLAPGEVAEVLAAATLRRLRAKSLVAREGHSADEIFLLLDGQARHFTMTREGEKIVILWRLPGETFGGRTLLSKRPMFYLVSTEIVVDSNALVWGRSAIRALAKRYPRLLENGLLLASDYLANFRDLHIRLSYDKADKRVAWVLEKLSREVGHKVAGGTELKIRNEELANEANVTIYTVSRLLSEWDRKGFLTKGRGRVVIHSLQGLGETRAGR
jgi:CRP/FNR family transcriptional regulator, nitrogen oxide reductase regulator